MIINVFEHFRDSLEYDILRFLCFTETEENNNDNFKNNNLRIADFVIKVHS